MNSMQRLSLAVWISTVWLASCASIDYAAMYDNECSQPSPTSTSDSDVVADVDYASKYDKYYKNKNGAENEYGSVKDNPMGGGGDDKSQESVFCECMKKEQKSGKSYASSQNDFSKCVDKANGNDAKHWKEVAKQYEHKYGGGGFMSTSEGSSSSSDSAEAETAAVLLAVPVPTGDDDPFGNAAIAFTFIGACLLVLVCACFIKGGLHKWNLREYEFVKYNSPYDTETDADANGNPYGVNESDWDDNYDSNYAQNSREEKIGKKAKFSQWNQYAAV